MQQASGRSIAETTLASAALPRTLLPVRLRDRFTMKPIRYIVGGVGFLLVWFVVAVVIGVVMALIFPVPGEQAFVGIGLGWRNLPGTVLGLLAGIQSFRASVRGPKKKDAK